MVEEPRSEDCRRLLRADRHLAVWALTRTEMVSAIQRKARSGELDSPGVRAALRRTDLLAAGWTEVDALLPVRDHAERLLRLHDLHAADALQLAAAIVLFDSRPRGRSFLTADARLAEAAEREGLMAVIPTAKRGPRR